MLIIYSSIDPLCRRCKPILGRDDNTGINLHAPLTSPTQNVLRIQQNMTDNVKISLFSVILYEMYNFLAARNN